MWFKQFTKHDTCWCQGRICWGGIVISLGNLKNLYTFTWEHNTLAYVLLWVLKSFMKSEVPERACGTKEKAYMKFHMPVDDHHTALLMTTEGFNAFSIGFISAGKRRVQFQLASFRLPMLSVVFALGHGPICWGNLKIFSHPSRCYKNTCQLNCLHLWNGRPDSWQETVGQLHFTSHGYMNVRFFLPYWAV